MPSWYYNRGSDLNYPGGSEHVFNSAASDAGTDNSNTSSVLADNVGVVILTPSGSSSASTNDIINTRFAGNLTPSVTSEPAAAPSANVEDLLKDEFDNLTFADKAQALASVRNDQYAGSGASSDALTEALTEHTDAKINDDTTVGEKGKPSLADWQALCKAVGVAVNEMPTSIKQCKKTLKRYNTNLSDLSDALRDGTVAQTFPSVAALSRYSKRTGKIASKAVVKKDPLLKMMLRELFRSGKGKN